MLASDHLYYWIILSSNLQFFVLIIFASCLKFYFYIFLASDLLPEQYRTPLKTPGNVVFQPETEFNEFELRRITSELPTTSSNLNHRLKIKEVFDLYSQDIYRE